MKSPWNGSPLPFHCCCGARQDEAPGKGTLPWNLTTELDPLDPHGWRREPTLAVCLLTYITQRHTIPFKKNHQRIPSTKSNGSVIIFGVRRQFANYIILCSNKRRILGVLHCISWFPDPLKGSSNGLPFLNFVLPFFLISARLQIGFANKGNAFGSCNW